MVHFGWLSFVLLLGAVQGSVVAGLLIARSGNRAANVMLAALIALFVARLVPFIIGYAGFYDAYPWLSFFPFAPTLAYGPLIYLYVVLVTTGRLPARWLLHLLPAFVQIAYYTVIFVQPLTFKNNWDHSVQEPFVVPAETIAMFASLGAYLALSFAKYRSYRASLRESTSDPYEAHLTWLQGFLTAFSVAVVLNLGWDLWDAFVHRLDYFAYFPLYVCFTVMIYYLALEGYRHASHALPQTSSPPVFAKELAFDAEREAQSWLALMRTSRHYCDPALTLALLAKRLETSPGKITRIVNDGLGQNFSEAINRLRLEEVCRALEDPADARDLLAIAFGAGFNSKASFNRVFKAVLGTTPTAYRRFRRFSTSHLLRDW